MSGHRLVALALLSVVIAILGASCSSPSPNSIATVVVATPAPPTPTAIPTIALTFDPTPTAANVPSVPAVPENPTPLMPTPRVTATSQTVPPAPDTIIEAIATVGRCDFRLEVADDTTERSRGLMERESMPIDQGMLFVFDFQQELNFWMRNTLIPLDIAYLNDELHVVDVQTMIPEHEILPDLLPIYTSAFPAKFALELNAGVAADCGITPGVTMSLTYITG